MTKKINVVVNGLPGNMATNVAEYIRKTDDLELITRSMTGPEITNTHTYLIGGVQILLVKAGTKEAEKEMQLVHEKKGNYIAVDFSHPSAVNANADFYCRNLIPFVMGTTGGDREALEARVRMSAVPAVIAPNMAKQIVGFQAMMEYAAQNFPGLFEGYEMVIAESHQAGKADTSGTAKAMVKYFNAMGVDFDVKQIHKERDPDVQMQMGIPEKHLKGHGWHTYDLVSSDGTTRFEFTHTVNGRDIYSAGTIDAIRFLAKKVEDREKGVVYSMIDVLKG